MKSYIHAARLRTLPLSLSGIIMGCAYAFYQGFSNWKIATLALLTTLGLQILSNFANDYGDGIRGTDVNRIGEKRMVAAGIITPKQMKNAVIITSIITLILALSLIYVAFGKENFFLSAVFIVLGISAVAAAIKYTVGSNAYGYSGFGDIFVFFFFGLVSVLGSHFLFAKTIDMLLFLPAIAVGMLSVAVLNLNNLRDVDNDRIAGKNSLIVKFGLKFGIWYQRILVFVPVVLLFSFLFLVFQKGNFLFLAVFLGYAFVHNNFISKVIEPSQFDSQLKKIALFTFFITCVTSTVLIISKTI